MNTQNTVAWAGGYMDNDHFRVEAVFSTKEKADEWVAWKKDVERLLPWDVEEYPLDPEEVDRT